MATQESINIEEAFRNLVNSNTQVQTANLQDATTPTSTTYEIPQGSQVGADIGGTAGAALADSLLGGGSTAAYAATPTVEGSIYSSSPALMSTATPTTTAATGVGTSAGGVLSGAAALSLPVLLGLSGFPKQYYDNTFGSAGWEAANPEKAAQLKLDIKAYQDSKAAPYGGDYQAYLAAQRPPKSPIEYGIEAIYANNEGDKPYQIDELQQYYMSPEGQQKMKNYWAANPDFFTPDGKRIYNDRDQLEAMIELAKNRPDLPQVTADQVAASNEAIAAKEQELGIPLSQPTAVPVSQTSSTGGNIPGAGTGNVGSTVSDIFNGITNPSATSGTPNSSIANPQLPEGATFQFTPQQMQAGEHLTTDGKLLDPGVTIDMSNLNVQAATLKAMGYPSVQTIAPLPDLQSILAGITDDQLIGDVTSQISQRYLDAEAANKAMIDSFQVFQGSTVKEQLAMLQDDWVGTNGENKVPFYALGAVTAAKQEMAARGMGGSSMAAAAITQAGLEAMIPVAMKDAEFFQTLSVKKFDMQTSMGLAKLSHIANLDMADLNFRQQRAVDTANKFFQVNMSNVENERLVAATNNANRVQKLFADAAAVNVANNLGYTTEAEMNRFYDQLALSAQTTTANLLLDASKFNAAVQNERTQFNATMMAEIERDNINYLRSINTANTAGINQQNLINSQNLLGISNTAIANDLTLTRDQLNRIFEASENMATRMNNYAIAKLEADAAMSRLTSQQDYESSAAIGGFLQEITTPLISGLVGSIFGNGSTTTTPSTGTNITIPSSNLTGNFAVNI